MNMKYEKVLQQIENGELTSQEAYSMLYTPQPSDMGKRAHFIKMRINVPEEGKGVNTFLRILFAIPFPMIFARMGIRLADRFVKDQDIDFKAIGQLLKYSKNTRVHVDSKDAQVDIRIM